MIALRDGQAGIAIGDVVGHGLDAAARMARLQNALRAYALEGLRPSLVLERMNGFAREVAGGPMATLLYGVVDPDEGRLRLATAGHPPVLVIGPDGRGRTSPRAPRAARSGWSRSRPTRSRRSRSIPGSTVLLYTDGLVERPEASLDEGLEWLRGFAAGVPAHPDELCGALLQARFRDAAAARRRRPARGPARAGAAGADRDHAARRAGVAGADAPRARSLAARRGRRATPTTYETLVACGEACANAIAHAYPPGEASYVVEARRRDDGIEVRVRDFGSWRAAARGLRRAAAWS